MRLGLAIQAALLRLAPPGFRVRFGPELLDVTRRTLEDTRRRQGSLASSVLALLYALDLALNVFRLQLESPSMRCTLLLLPFALLAAAGTAWIDTHAKEVQPAVLLLFVITAVLSFLDMRRAWLWWLVLGLSIPGAHLVARVRGTALPYEVEAFAWTFLALIPAGAGALLGVGLRAWTQHWPARTA